jgi:hypothetical protein
VTNVTKRSRTLIAKILHYRKVACLAVHLSFDDLVNALITVLVRHSKDAELFRASSVAHAFYYEKIVFKLQMQATLFVQFTQAMCHFTSLEHFKEKKEHMLVGYRYHQPRCKKYHTICFNRPG